MNRYFLTRKFRTYFEDPPVPPPPPPPPAGKTFTQADVDRMMQEHRQSLQKTVKEQTDRLEQLQNTANLTAAEKAELQQTLENLSNQHKTEAQRQAEAADKAKKKFEADIEAEKAEKIKYQNGYHGLIVTNAIQAGAAKHKAADPTGHQLKLMLLPQAKVIDQPGEDGKPTGKLVAVMPLSYTDPKTKKPVSVELPIDEAIGKMAEMDEFANLFLVDGKPGVGGQSGAGAKTGTNGTPDFSKMTAIQYREWRAKQPK